MNEGQRRASKKRALFRARARDARGALDDANAAMVTKGGDGERMTLEHVGPRRAARRTASRARARWREWGMNRAGVK